VRRERGAKVGGAVVPPRKCAPGLRGENRKRGTRADRAMGREVRWAGVPALWHLSGFHVGYSSARFGETQAARVGPTHMAQVIDGRGETGL
jgi:hypothetical protein